MPLPKRREDEEPTDWGKTLKTVSSWGPPAMEMGEQEPGDDAPPPDMVDAGPPPSSLASLTQHFSGLDVGPQETAADSPPDVVDAPAAPAKPSVKDLLAPFARVPGAGPAGPDGELEGARQGSDDAFLRAQRGRAGSDFIAAFGGYKPDNSFWDAEEAHGKQGMADLEKKRAMLRQGKQDSRQERLDEAASQLQQLEMAKRTKALQPGQSAALAELFGVAPEVLDGMTPEGRKEFLDAWKSNNTVQAAKLAKEAEREFQLGRDKAAREYGHVEGGLHDASRERAAALSAGAKIDEKNDAAAAKVGADLEGTATLKSSFDAIDAALGASPKDLPGVGPWDSRKPEIFDSQTDTTVKQALKQIIARILKKQSGSTVSEDEYNRTLSSYGIGPNSPEGAFATGYAAMKRAAIEGAKEAEAKQSPKAVETYRARGGVTSEDFQPKPKAAAGPKPASAKVTITKDGKHLLIPRARLKDAMKDGWSEAPHG